MATSRAAASWRRSPDVLGRRLVDGWLLLGPAMGTPVHLSTTATEIWDHLATGATNDELLTALTGRYTGTPGEIAHDIGEAMTHLEGLGLVARGD